MTMPEASKKTGPRRLARDLLRGALTAAVASIDRETGEPYAAFTVVAVDHDASPILLLSTLSDHCQNALEDDRISLLVDQAHGLPHPMTGARVSVQGHLQRSDDPHHRARYLNRHPAAEQYVDFGDFAFYRLAVTRLHLIGGFGVAKWYDASDVLFDCGDHTDLRQGEADILTHMNADHGEAIGLYANRLAGQPGDGWVMTGIDPEGLDLRRAGEVARLAFETPIRNPDEARKVLVELAKKARN